MSKYYRSPKCQNVIEIAPEDMWQWCLKCNSPLHIDKESNNYKDNNVEITWKTEFSFGKYKGHTLQEVYDKDRKYIGWLCDTVTDKKEVAFIKQAIEKAEKDRMKIEEPFA